MNRESFEKSQLFLQAWREAGHLGEQCMTAIAFALRNRQRAGWEGGMWLKIIENADRIRYNTQAPNTGFPDLRDPGIYRFLARIDGIYDGSTPDTFTSCTQKFSDKVFIGKYWADLSAITNEKFLQTVVRSPLAHPKTSTVGTLTFFA